MKFHGVEIKCKKYPLVLQELKKLSEGDMTILYTLVLSLPAQEIHYGNIREGALISNGDMG